MQQLTLPHLKTIITSAAKRRSPTAASVMKYVMWNENQYGRRERERERERERGLCDIIQRNVLRKLVSAGSVPALSPNCQCLGNSPPNRVHMIRVSSGPSG